MYGSYFGYLRLVELDPKTGKRIDPNDQPRNLAINYEASILIHRDGWYYLLATRGSCCRGAESGYNIRMGRSRKVTGPYVDHTGLDMIQGGGTLFAGSSGRVIGPGHFGLLDLGDGVQRFSIHYEADLDRGGASVLDIRPLVWRDGWPVAGENLKEGAYQLESARTGTALELAVEGTPVGGRRGGRGGPPGVGPGGRGAVGRLARGGPPTGGGRGLFAGTGSPIPSQDVAEVSKTWPSGNVDVRMATYLCQAQQKWAIAPAPAPVATPARHTSRSRSPERIALWRRPPMVNWSCCLPSARPPEQLWRIEQLPDGAWRVMPKAVARLEGAAGPFGGRRKLRDTVQVRSEKRQTSLADQDAVIRGYLRELA